MSSKSRKSITAWLNCEKCQSFFSQKDAGLHEANCPPTLQDWPHSFILNETLYSKIESYGQTELPKNISEREGTSLVFIATSTLQMCKIAIGDPVVLTNKGNIIVKTAWPTNEKSLTSVSVLKDVIELNKLEGNVKVEKLNATVYLAGEIQIEYTGKHSLPKDSTELNIILKNFNEQKIFSVGNRLSVPFYGRKLTFKIVDIKSDRIDEPRTNRKNLIEKFEELSVDEETILVKFCKATYGTKWTIADKKSTDSKDSVRQIVRQNTLEDIGGYDSLITDVKDILDIALGKYRNISGFNICKGVLLYGSTGVGKTLIANALIFDYNVHVCDINNLSVYSKSDTERKLRDSFDEAKANSPSIIFIEDIDTLCPRKNNSSSDNERKILATLIALMDDLQASNERVVVLATTSKIEMIDSALRRPGRIDNEFEVSVPTPRMRLEILRKFLSRTPNTLSSDEIEKVAFTTHGFVGADLHGLCSRAIIQAIKRNANDSTNQPEVTIKDFEYALTVAKPSAMKEVLVEVPNVKWSDIGGQADLKLKLKQAVEWPLKHPEIFTRMGITPPRGVLMFGPPGCSKTMIAKALATESKLNFLNIKGPELFSKWVGESERAVRELFRKARQVAPSIIFIDEIDALGGERASGSGNGGNNVQERVLAQLLTELDGVTVLGNVTLVAATNRPDRIDKALLRPGRLDRIVYVPLPDYETRREIFEIKLKKMPIDKEVKIEHLVELTEGYSGAEIQAICHEAAMKALEEDLTSSTITKDHFRVALSMVYPRTPASLIKLYEEYTVRT